MKKSIAAAALLVLVPSAHATSLGEMFYDKLGWVARLDLSNIAPEGNEAAFWAKLILWIVLFAVLYYVGSTRIFTDKKRIAGVLAAAIALGIIAVPNELIKRIIQTYQIVGIAFIIGLPVAAVFIGRMVLGKELKDNCFYHAAAAIGIYLVIVVMSNLGEAIKRSYDIFEYTSWFGFAFAMLELLMLYHIFGLLFCGKPSPAVQEVRRDWGNLGDALRDLFRERARERTRGRELRDALDETRDAVDDCMKAKEHAMEAVRELEAHADDKRKEKADKALEKVKREAGKEEQKLEVVKEKLEEMEKWVVARAATLREFHRKLTELKHKKRVSEEKYKELTNELKEEERLVAGKETDIREARSKLHPLHIKARIEAFVDEARGHLDNPKYALELLEKARELEEEFRRVLEELNKLIRDINALIGEERVIDRKLKKLVEEGKDEKEKEIDESHREIGEALKAIGVVGTELTSAEQSHGSFIAELFKHRERYRVGKKKNITHVWQAVRNLRNLLHSRSLDMAAFDYHFTCIRRGAMDEWLKHYDAYLEEILNICEELRLNPRNAHDIGAALNKNPERVKRIVKETSLTAKVVKSKLDALLKHIEGFRENYVIFFNGVKEIILMTRRYLKIGELK